MARIFYFAWVRERIGLAEEQIDLPADANTVAEMLAFLRGRGEPYAATLADNRLRVAVNQIHAQPGDAVKNGDEIAIFPPVSGG